MNRYQKIIDYLELCIQKDILSHAYIFYGPDEIAKKEIALKFAYKILDAGVGFHPDFILISADGDEERSINAIRQLKKFLILSPISGKYKIAIIEAAEKLNSHAQSALLKIFEEAPQKSIIILYAKTIDSIPYTIASRGVKLPFWRRNDSELAINKKIKDNFSGILSSNFKNQHRYFEKLNTFKAVEIFKMWLEFLRTEFLRDPNQKLIGILKTSQNVYFKLNETNINQKFAYDELILNLWNF